MVYPNQRDIIVPDRLGNYLASNLRLLRKRLGLSQQELAESVSLNRGNIASYEAGIAEPKLCKLLRISELVGVNSRDLMRVDLSQPSQLSQALQAYSEQHQGGKRCIESRLARLESMKTVLDSIKKIYTFKISRLDLSHPDVKALSSYHEELQNIAQELVEAQQDILHELKCHSK